MPLSLDDSTIKQRLTAYLAGLPGIRFASLFGSWSTERARADSDVDLAVDFGRRLTADELVSIARDLARIARREVDLVDLSTARGALLTEILVKGERLYQTSPEETARLLKRMWYDREDDGRARQHTQKTRLQRWTR
jgi:predicted nucleotidyltransferase